MSPTESPLATLLDVEAVGPDSFQGRAQNDGWSRVFGGLVVAQALVAAQRTVDNRAAHSLHAYFILPGDPKLPIAYAVERIRDGKSFATRRCVASQQGRAIFALSASFQAAESGLSHQVAMPVVPAPEALASEGELAARFSSIVPESVRRFLTRERPIELRPVDLMRFCATRAAVQPGPQYIWVRVKATLPDDASVHRAALAYLSDMTLLDAALAPVGRTIFEPRLQIASLDHAVWFHRPFRADQWLLYSQDSPTLSGARGLARGLLFNIDGDLVASVAQEGLVRERAG